jgi:hypothetical protein
MLRSCTLIPLRNSPLNSIFLHESMRLTFIGAACGAEGWAKEGECEESTAARDDVKLWRGSGGTEDSGAGIVCEKQKNAYRA